VFFVDPDRPADQKVGFIKITAAGACCHRVRVVTGACRSVPDTGVSAPALDFGRYNGCFLPAPGCQVSSLVKDWDPVQRSGQVSGQS